MSERPGGRGFRTPTVVAAADLGGSNLRIALVNRDLSLLRRHHETNGSNAHPASILRRLDNALRTMLEETPATVVGVGFALAAILDAEEGVVHHTPNLPPTWHGFRARDELERALNLPAVIGNDANLAALAEARAQAPNVRCLLYLTVSTGIGGGVVYRGRSFLGGKGLGPEAGHIVVVADGPSCNCGGRGCLEALASGSAIAREAREAARRDTAGALASLLREGRPLDARAVQEAAQSGDPAAREILTNAGHYLGLGLASLAHAFSPEVIVIGGGVSRAGELVLGPARQAFAAQTMGAYREGVRIVPAALGDDSALVGAALVAWSHVRRRAREQRSPA